MRDVCRVAFTILAAVVSSAARAEEPEPLALVVVVGTTSPVRRVTSDELREVYLRRQRVWADGTRAIPVNLPAGSAAREVFSRRVLGRSTRDLVSYWNARYFEGITPPPVLPSAASVRAYLAAEPGAIGYLPADETDATCRVLLRLDLGAR